MATIFFMALAALLAVPVGHLIWRYALWRSDHTTNPWPRTSSRPGSSGAAALWRPSWCWSN